MSAFGNESFDVDGAGGWARGDRHSAFDRDGEDSASQDPDKRASDLDKIPMPVAVADLAQLELGQERIQLGALSFPTVYVVGKIKSVVVDSSHQQVNYMVGDLDDDSASFGVVYYKGVADTDKATSSAFVEDTFVSVVGKIRSFDDKLSIVAFDVLVQMFMGNLVLDFNLDFFQLFEVEDSRQIETFKLQAKLAKLYYKKDASHISDRTLLTGTMLQSKRGGAPDVHSEDHKQAGGFGASDISRPNAAVGHDSENCRGLSGQKAEIFKCLKRNVTDVNVGMSVDQIRANIPKHLFNAKTFAADLDDLSSEGLIYTTLDDDHYVVNS
ncbi:unnamed protein product [Anisakis simplex]|uniref:RPA_C domain-containing protein n=1 Tax=Anisakis simplex TaxID=6269 RepID=A0A0M3K9V0_ANISI|nr:unnamed protein product [Anisakis simplex]